MNSPSISALDLEGTSLALLVEFLNGYFDGASHVIGSNPTMVFPKATVRTQESPQPQPATAVGISIVWIAPSRIETKWDNLTVAEQGIYSLPAGRQQRACAQCGWLFLVRSVTAGADANAQKQVADAAGLLHALLANSKATLPLSEKGIKHLRPLTPRLAFPGDGAPTADLAYRLRTVSCKAELRYLILSQ